MEISSLLPPENIITDLQAVSRRDIFSQLINPLCVSQVVRDRETFADALEQREEQITTQMENQVAMPHARSLTVTRLGMSLGITPEPGLNFGSDPNRKCRLFFLIAIPNFAPSAHLSLLKKLAGFAHDQKRLDRFFNCRTKKQMIKQLQSFRG